MTMSMFGNLSASKKNHDSEVIGKYPEYYALAKKRYRECVAYFCWERKRLRGIANKVNRQDKPTVAADQPGWHGTMMPEAEPTMPGIDYAAVAQAPTAAPPFPVSMDELDMWSQQASAPGEADVEAEQPDETSKWLAEGVETAPYGAADSVLAAWMEETAAPLVQEAGEPASAAEDDAMAAWLQEVSPGAADEAAPNPRGSTANALKTRQNLPAAADDQGNEMTEEPSESLADLLAYVPTDGSRAGIIGGKAKANGKE